MKPSLCRSITVALAALVCIAVLPKSASAQQQIVHPWIAIRSMGMGGVRTSTGLYEENFFGNPARVTENPKPKFSLFDLMLESKTATIGNVYDLVANSDAAQEKLSDTAGENNHARVQFTLFSFYLPNHGKWSYAFGFFTGLQSDLALRRSYQINPGVIADIGPAFTIGRKFLDDENLSIGATVQASYRVSSTDRAFSLIDLVQGRKLSPADSGGDGGGVDGSLGAYYKIPYAIENWLFTTGFSINNVLGGKFQQFSFKINTGGNAPIPQSRSYNVGVSSKRSTWWKLSDTVFAFEVNDIGLNNGGSFFRLLHFGGETRYGIATPRLGFNQGYICAGLGLDFRVLTLDLATYGEEMSLNAGGLQDRRIALKFGLQI